MVVENQSYTCSNPSCGKVFSNPLKTENFGSKRGHTYEACPYCLTEIVVEASSLGREDEERPEIEETQRTETSPHLNEEVKQSTSVEKCQHQLGYLSKRSPKEKIPEECMMCSKIVECMLKNVTG